MLNGVTIFWTERVRFSKPRAISDSDNISPVTTALCMTVCEEGESSDFAKRMQLVTEQATMKMVNRKLDLFFTSY